MKKLFILIAFIFSTAFFSNVFAQQAAPPGAGDKDLSDKNVKTRSIDLERVDRDARKENGEKANPAKNSNADKPTEDKLAAKYDEIKTDFEQVQMSQNAIIKAYQSGSAIDYTQISKSAQEINKSAMRLDLNLFPAPIAENTGEKEEVKKEEPQKDLKSVRDLIVDLDNAIGNFALSPMFQNLRLIDPKMSIKAKIDLKKIIELSAMLDAEAQKMANGGK